MKKLLFLAFVLLAAAQLFIPLNMIWQTNRILNHGDEIKLLIDINEHDALQRSGTIFLNFHHNYVPADPEKTPERGSRIFLMFEPDENDIYVPVSYSVWPPEGDAIYIVTTVSYSARDENRVHFNWPVREFNLPGPVTIPSDENRSVNTAINAVLNTKVLNGRMIPVSIEIP